EGTVRLRVTTEAGTWPEGVIESPGASGGFGPFHRPVAHAATTLLGRSIAHGEGDVDARLDAAILRTLGGADDLRSPRAPGLLVALTDHGLDADRLAMAGWIAPLGANRGAWLDRARSVGDAGTKAFAQ